MRYFLDTEYDGFGGRLLSLALVPEDGGEELYLVIDQEASDPWVQRHVVPFLDHVPEAMKGPRLPRDAAARALAHFLAFDEAAEIIARGAADVMLAVGSEAAIVKLAVAAFDATIFLMHVASASGADAAASAPAPAASAAPAMPSERRYPAATITHALTTHEIATWPPKPASRPAR